MITSSLTTWPPESNFILKQRIACQMKALKNSFEMRVRVAGLSSLDVEEFLSAAPSISRMAQLSEQECDT